MTAPISETVLRGSLRALALVATGTGVSVAAGGPDMIPGGAPTAGSNDSVLRFYAVWWAAQGPALWRLAQQPDIERGPLWSVCATTFLGGCARLGAARASGRPHPLFQALTVVELLGPPALLVLHRRVAAWPGERRL